MCAARRCSSPAVIVSPPARSAALAGRLSAHLNKVPAGRRRVAILNGAEEYPAIDALAGLGNVADTSLLDARRNARRVIQHVCRGAPLVDRREVGVARAEELRGIRIEPGRKV